MRLSVLIATYNRKTLLKKCLSHLLDKAQELPDEVVIVVGGRDSSADVVRRYQTRFNFLKLVEVENKSVGDSHNKGLPHCTGDFVATLDDDAFVFPDWTLMVKRAHREHPEAGCVGGRIINMSPENLIARLESHTELAYDRRQGFYTHTIAGASCTYKRHVMEEVGIFDNTLPASTDNDYNWRIVKAGFKVWFDPSIKMYHQNRTSLKGFLRQQTWYGRGYYQVRRKHSDLSSAYPRGLRQWQDWVKLFWFVPGIFASAVLNGMRASYPRDKLTFAVLLVFKGIWWRYGWIKQWAAKTD